jgi:hypothetical protein
VSGRATSCVWCATVAQFLATPRRCPIPCALHSRRYELASARTPIDRDDADPVVGRDGERFAVWRPGGTADLLSWELPLAPRLDIDDPNGRDVDFIPGGSREGDHRAVGRPREAVVVHVREQLPWAAAARIDDEQVVTIVVRRVPTNECDPIARRRPLRPMIVGRSPQEKSAVPPVRCNDVQVAQTPFAQPDVCDRGTVRRPSRISLKRPVMLIARPGPPLVGMT